MSTYTYTLWRNLTVIFLLICALRLVLYSH
jgi:hypothetical protein